MNQDEEHLRLLSIFHYVCAGLIAFFACIPILHFVVGLLILFQGNSPGHRDPMERFIGLLFVIFPIVFIFVGWTLAGLLAWAGRCLSRRVNHTFCLVMAGVACVFMPFGTALGIFTILVLMRPSVKALFAPVRQPPVMS